MCFLFDVFIDKTFKDSSFQKLLDRLNFLAQNFNGLWVDLCQGCSNHFDSLKNMAAMGWAASFYYVFIGKTF